MKIVPAKCPNCGGTLNVDLEKDAAICQYCGSPFIVQKAVDNYNTTINNQTINNSGTINVENVHIHNDDGVEVNNLFTLGVQAMHGGNASEGFMYFSKVLEKDIDNGAAILFKGICAAFLSQIVVASCLIRLNEMNVAFDRVFSSKEIYSKLTQNDINDAYSQALNAIHSIAALALNNYRPGYRQMNNINMLWTSLEQCYVALTVLGSHITVAFPDEPDENQKAIIKATAEMTSALLGQLLEKRQYSVDWGPRSGIGQINTVEHPQHDYYVKVKKEFDEQATQMVAGFQPIKIEKVKSNSNNTKNAFSNMVKSNSNNGCYIATCVYGSYDCPQVWILRRYRDYYLDEHWWGKLFISIYYAISPKVVAIFGKTKWFNKVFKLFLDKKINSLTKKGYKDTIYKDKY